MTRSIFKKINKYLETVLARISIRQLLVILLLFFFSAVLSVFVISTYRTMYKTVYQERIEKLKYVADFAINILEYQNSLVLKHKITIDQAKKNTIDMIKDVRFENDNYIWVHNYQGKILSHPYKKMIGTSVNSYTDTRNINFGPLMVEIPKRYGRGYLSYYWSKPTGEKDKSYQKVSYVIGYRNWDWIIGTGIYVDDIKEKVIAAMMDGVFPVLSVLLLLILIFRYIILTSLVDPINELADKSLKLASNDLTIVLPETKSTTELGKLYTAFNQFVTFFKAKRDNEKILSLIHDSIADGLVTIDTDGNIQSVNPTIEAMFEYNSDEIIGENVDLLIYPGLFKDNESEDKSLKNILGKFELIGIKKSKEQINIEVAISEFRYNDTNMFILLIRDISEQKEVERMKNEFISVISHELRTPLTSIRGALGLVYSEAFGKLPEKAKNLLDIASNNVIRLVNLINDILDLEKIKSGKMDFKYAEYDVMPLVEEAIQLNNDYAKQYEVTFEIKERLDDALINVDKDKLIQVMTNLLSNASKFSTSGESVEIYVTRNMHLISVSVVNKGYGIPEESCPQIFESFYQVDSSDSRKKGGTGLGLNISKSIVQKMGGSIGFNSIVNDKTTFFFEFPEIFDKKIQKTALVVEDNRTTAFGIKTMLEKLDFQTDIALTAQEAEDMLALKEYDLMTLDILLPDKNGLTLLDELRNNEATKNLPVIVVSASEKDKFILDSEHCVADWLEKSFDLEALTETVNQIMLKKQQNKVNILHVENDFDILNITSSNLKDFANITTATTLSEAETILNNFVFDIIILDYKLPDGNCDGLISVIRNTSNRHAKLIVFSAYEINEFLSSQVDAVIQKTKVSNEQFCECIEKFVNKSTIVNGSKL